MSWFFADPEAVVRLVAEAKSWHGTPFAEYSCAKGYGIDCVGFVQECVAAAGLERFEIPRTEHDYSRHIHNHKILDYLRGRHSDAQSNALAARWAELPVVEHDFVDPPMAGDILVYKDGQETGVFHLPVMIASRKFMQAAPHLGVCEGNIHDTFYSSHLMAHFRARATPQPLNPLPSQP